MVQMKHPKLPAHQTIDVPEIGVKHRERAGWQPVRGDKPVERPTEKPAEKPETKLGKADAKPQNDEGAN